MDGVECERASGDAGDRAGGDRGKIHGGPSIRQEYQSPANNRAVSQAWENLFSVSLMYNAAICARVLLFPSACTSNTASILLADIYHRQ